MKGDTKMTQQLTIDDAKRIIDHPEMSTEQKAVTIIALHRVDMNNLLNAAANKFSEVADDLRSDL